MAPVALEERVPATWGTGIGVVVKCAGDTSSVVSTATPPTVILAFVGTTATPPTVVPAKTIEKPCIVRRGLVTATRMSVGLPGDSTAPQLALSPSVERRSAMITLLLSPYK